MKVPDGSKRTKVLFWLYMAVLAVAVALMFWLFAVLIAHYVVDVDLPRPPLIEWLTIALLPLVTLRLALAWSMNGDRPRS